MYIKVVLHIIGWILFIYSKEMNSNLAEWEQQDIWLSISLHGIRILTFYIAYFFLWPKFLRIDQWPKLLLGLILICLFFPTMRYLIEEVIYPQLFGFGNFTDPTSWYYIENNLWWYAVPTVSTSALVFLFEKSQRDKENQLILQREKTTAELAFLRSQVNPHFLFNTLHFLHTEAFQVDPALAETILKVSEILRYSVESTKEGKRSIEREIELIENYLDIFKMRYEDQCFVNFENSAQDAHQLIEPLLLIPFVENAFKHGQFSKPESPIKIAISVDQDVLTFSIENHIKQQAKDPGHGIGIANVKRRLAVLYPDKHKLKIEESSQLYSVMLTLQL